MTESAEKRPRGGDVAILLALGAVAGAVFFVRFPVPLRLLGAHLANGLVALLVLAASLTCGRLAFPIARRLFAAAAPPPAEARQPDAMEILLVGIPVLGTVMLAVAWSGIMIGAVSAVLVFGLALPAAMRVARGGIAWGPVPLRPLAPLSIPVAFALLGAMSPVSSPDEIIYKLAVPDAYLKWGAMVELPLHGHSYIANAVGMADFAAMAIRGGGAARMLHFAIFLLALRVCWRLGEEFREGAGPWVAAMFAWTPAILLVAGWAWTEWASLGLLLLSWHRWWRFVRPDGDASDAAVSMLALAGAVATKYTAGPWVAVFVPIAIALLLKERRAGLGRVVAASAAVLFVFGGIFYVRNLVWTGAPLAPFGLDGSPAVTNFRSDKGGLYELLMGWDIVHEAIIDDALGILLSVAVLASPLALRRRSPDRVAFFVLGVVQTAALVVLAPTSRLILLGVAPLALLGSTVAHDAFRDASRGWRRAMAVAIALAFWGQLLLCGFVLQRSYEPFAVLTGGESEAAYLARTRTYVPVYRWIETNTSPESVVLMLGESRPFHLDRRAHWAGNLDGPRVAAWLARSRDPDTMRASMRELGITHVLVHKKNYVVSEMAGKKPGMLEKEYVLEVPARVDDTLRACLREHAQLAYTDKTYLLFALD